MIVLESININNLIDTYLVPWGINIGLALLIFIVGRFAVSIIIGIVRKLLSKAGMDNILINFISAIVSWLLLLVVVIQALSQLGVDTNSLIVLIGAAGLAIGLSLRDFLQNFAAGVMLLIFRPFKEGDSVEAGGIAGSVKQINIFSTTFLTADNKQVIVPNGAIYSGVITNNSATGTRRIDMVFGIGYEDDIEKAKGIIEEIIKSESRILNTPEYLIAVGELADSSVNIYVRPWVSTSNYWSVKFDFIEKIKLEFDKNGISIPYPQMDVHIDNEKEEQKPE
ncbi:MAG: mechanosensitive ion channel [Candidatus Dadabacteria bacterium]|nr:MAG: mechanosensitive ion channel [Candidatus Dadabacteria bacterium]TDJ01452.1 MAG: mechanosensitive ion channel [Candidatus Dadabacteria bacterium]